MTKNSDVSWIPKPVGCSLKRFTTAELVAELSKRGGVECRWILKGRDEQWPDNHTISVCGPCKILVVRE